MDPDPDFWPNLDPDSIQGCYNFFLNNCKKILALEEEVMFLNWDFSSLLPFLPLIYPIFTSVDTDPYSEYGSFFVFLPVWIRILVQNTYPFLFFTCVDLELNPYSEYPNPYLLVFGISVFGMGIWILKVAELRMQFDGGHRLFKI